MVAARAAQDQRIPAVFDECLSIAGPIRARYLGDGLESKDASSSKFPEPGQGILQTIDLSQGIQLIDHEPKTLITLGLTHRFKDRESHPRGNRRAQRCDLARLVRYEQHSLSVVFAAYPLPDGQRLGLLLCDVVERPDNKTKDRPERIKHP